MANAAQILKGVLKTNVISDLIQRQRQLPTQALSQIASLARRSRIFWTLWTGIRWCRIKKEACVILVMGTDLNAYTGATRSSSFSTKKIQHAHAGGAGVSTTPNSVKKPPQRSLLRTGVRATRKMSHNAMCTLITKCGTVVIEKQPQLGNVQHVGQFVIDVKQLRQQRL